MGRGGGSTTVKWVKNLEGEKNWRGHPDLNQGPLDLQSNALPLSYTPIHIFVWYTSCIYSLDFHLVNMISFTADIHLRSWLCF